MDIKAPRPTEDRVWSARREKSGMELGMPEFSFSEAELM